MHWQLYIVIVDNEQMENKLDIVDIIPDTNGKQHGYGDIIPGSKKVRFCEPISFAIGMCMQMHTRL